jgi:hypothetical protein
LKSNEKTSNANISANFNKRIPMYTKVATGLVVEERDLPGLGDLEGLIV